MNTVRKRALTVTLASVLLGGLVPAANATTAALATPGPTAEATTPVDDADPAQAPATREDRITDEAAYSNIPIEVYEFATDAERSHPSITPSFAWDDATATLTVTVDDAADATELRAAADEAALSSVEVVISPFDRESLLAGAQDILDAGTLAGSTVTWAAPRADGSGLDIGLETPAAALRTSGPQSVKGIPVTVVEVGEVEQAARDYDAGPEYIAGADMHSDSPSGLPYIKTCSTSFAYFGWSAGFEERLFTAHHCGGGPSATWRTGKVLSNPEIGNMKAVATVSDITSIAGKDYAPYMYHGANTSNSAVAVRGYVTPVVGGWMCYSGAPSGSVCGNEITHTGVTTGYGYGGLVRTSQYLGTPAVGNGDSGGPAYAVSSQGYAYAIGVISGMSNFGDTCTGDPSSASRKCSATAFFAPLAPYFAMNDVESLLTVPIP